MADLRESFTTGQTARLTEVAARTIDYWDLSGFLRPSIQQAAGKGTQRRWGFDDLVALKVAGQLRAAGISLQALRRVIVHLRARGSSTPLADTFLVSDGHDVYEKRGDELISTLRRPGQATFAWIVDLGAVVEELRQAVAA